MNRFNNVIFGQKIFLMNDQGELLILKRLKADVFSGMWDTPGGKLEDTDTLLEAITREVKEETDLNLKEVVLVLSSSKFQGDMNDRPLIFRNIYLGKAAGEVKLSEEHSEYKWIKPADLVKYQFPGDKDLQDVLSRLPHLLDSAITAGGYSKLF